MSGFDTYAVCECGYFESLPFGNTQHIHKSVCPDCGRSTYTWKPVVGRVENIGTFWHPRRALVPKKAADDN